MTIRRASLPGADELFRSTGEAQPAPPEETQATEPAQDPSPQAQEPAQSTQVQPRANLQVAKEASTYGDTAAPQRAEAGKRPRHDEKVTFYCTGEDLTRLERARLALRAEHGIATDRGRIVRAALEEVLDDFEARGPSSSLLKKLDRGR